MKKLNWALRLCKPQFIAEETCYYKRGIENRDTKCYFNDVLLHSRWYHSITYK